MRESAEVEMRAYVCPSAKTYSSVIFWIVVDRRLTVQHQWRVKMCPVSFYLSVILNKIDRQGRPRARVCPRARHPVGHHDGTTGSRPLHQSDVVWLPDQLEARHLCYWVQAPVERGGDTVPPTLRVAGCQESVWVQTAGRFIVVSVPSHNIENR